MLFQELSECCTKVPSGCCFGVHVSAVPRYPVSFSTRTSSTCYWGDGHPVLFKQSHMVLAVCVIFVRNKVSWLHLHHPTPTSIARQTMQDGRSFFSFLANAKSYKAKKCTKIVSYNFPVIYYPLKLFFQQFRSQPLK